jgi:hypothetical protein
MRPLILTVIKKRLHQLIVQLAEHNYLMHQRGVNLEFVFNAFRSRSHFAFAVLYSNRILIKQVTAF